MNLLFLLALCLVPFGSSTLAEHGSNRFAFALYAGVMALPDMLSAGLSAHGLREPYLGHRSEPWSGLRWDMVLSPLLAGMLFVVAAAVALGGPVRLAHWTLILIIPAMAFFGSQAASPLPDARRDGRTRSKLRQPSTPARQGRRRLAAFERRARAYQ